MAKHPGGRPTSYSPEYAYQARKLCLLGATDENMADFFNVAVATISNWKNDHPEFLEAIKDGKNKADSEVATRLYERAMGFEHDSEEIKIVKGKVQRLKIRKIYPPDTVAAIFWLKNRQKDTWRDKVETEHSGEVTHKFEDMDDEQLNRAIEARKNRAA